VKVGCAERSSRSDERRRPAMTQAVERFSGDFVAAAPAGSTGRPAEVSETYAEKFTAAAPGSVDDRQ